MFVSKLSHTLQATKHWISETPASTKSVSVKHCCSFTVWTWSQQSLKNAFQPAQAPDIPTDFSELLYWKRRWNMLPWSLLQPGCHPESSFTGLCVPQCPQGLLFSGDDPDPWWHVLQLAPQAHIPLALGTGSRCWALVSVSPLLNLHLRIYQRNHSDLSQQDFLNQQRRGRVWAVLHSSWWNVIWWYRELNTVILNLRTTRDCFLFLTSRF